MTLSLADLVSMNAELIRELPYADLLERLDYPKLQKLLEAMPDDQVVELCSRRPTRHLKADIERIPAVFPAETSSGASAAVPPTAKKKRQAPRTPAEGSQERGTSFTTEQANAVSAVMTDAKGRAASHPADAFGLTVDGIAEASKLPAKVVQAVLDSFDGEYVQISHLRHHENSYGKRAYWFDTGAPKLAEEKGAAPSERSAGIVADVRGALLTQPQTAHQIAKFLGEVKATVDAVLRQLVEAGDAVKSGTGKGVSFAASDALLKHREAEKAAPVVQTIRRRRDVDDEVIAEVLKALPGVAHPARSIAERVGGGLDVEAARNALEILKARGLADGDSRGYWYTADGIREANNLRELEAEDETALPPPPPPAGKPKRSSKASPPPVSHAEVQAVFDALTDRRGGAVARYLKTVEIIAEDAKVPHDKAKRALEILTLNGRAYAQEGMFFRDTGPEVVIRDVDDDQEEDEATADTERAPALTTDEVIAVLKDSATPLDVDQIAARTDRTAKEVREVVAILIKHPKRINSADGDGRWSLVPEEPAEPLADRIVAALKNGQLAMAGLVAETGEASAAIAIALDHLMAKGAVVRGVGLGYRLADAPKPNGAAKRKRGEQLTVPGA